MTRVYLTWKEGISNSCLSTKCKISQDWATNGTPINIPYLSSLLSGPVACIQQTAVWRHSTAPFESAEVGICSILEALLQWHLPNDPMWGVFLLFPGLYLDWQGSRNLKNRCLGLLCHCLFNALTPGKEDEKAGSLPWRK